MINRADRAGGTARGSPRFAAGRSAWLIVRALRPAVRPGLPPDDQPG
jgi:hypothetical protein